MFNEIKTYKVNLFLPRKLIQESNNYNKKAVPFDGTAFLHIV